MLRSIYLLQPLKRARSAGSYACLSMKLRGAKLQHNFKQTAPLRSGQA